MYRTAGIFAYLPLTTGLKLLQHIHLKIYVQIFPCINTSVPHESHLAKVTSLYATIAKLLR